MEIKPIAIYHGPFSTKFGIPRQSGLVKEIHGHICLTEEFRQAESLRGLERYDYVWLIWGFSANETAKKHPTVRPPLLGGNKRVGVWATRSPFRPNNLGLSSVKLVKVKADEMTLEVRGGDLMDGSPIYDIKPYLPRVDSHAEARAGFTDDHEWKKLRVNLPPDAAEKFTPEQLAALKETLALDPRPHYHADPMRQYGMEFAGHNVFFDVFDDEIHVGGIVDL